VRGIVTGLSISYVKKARGRLTAECSTSVPVVTGATPFEVHATVYDASGDIVARATVSWLLSPRK